MNTLNKVNEKIGHYRWTICFLLFFATTINYMDRQVLSLLKGVLEVEFDWSESDYSNIVIAFQLVYAVSMLFAGRFIDWLGTKKGYAWSLIYGHSCYTSRFLTRNGRFYGCTGTSRLRRVR